MKTNYILAGCFASKRDTLQQSIEKGDMELEYKSQLSLCISQKKDRSLSIFLKMNGLSRYFYLVESCKVFRNISIKHRSKNIVFKILSIYCPTKLVCNRPYSSIQFFSLLFLFIINCHNFSLSHQQYYAN